MGKTVFFHIILLLFAFQYMYSQNNASVNGNLYDQDLDTLRALYKKTKFKTDSTAKRNYARIFLNKAKALKSSDHITSGYFYLSYIFPEHSMVYLDSLIAYCEEKDYSNKYYPVDAFNQKGYKHKKNKEYYLSLENYIKGYQIAKKYQDEEGTYFARLGIASIKAIWGLHKESLIIYQELYQDLRKRDIGEENYKSFRILRYNLALDHMRNGNYDSTRYYCQLGKKKALVQKDTLSYYRFLQVASAVDLYNKNYNRALDSVKLATPWMSNKSLSINYTYQGKCYEQMGQPKLASVYYKKVDSLYDANGVVFDEQGPIYRFLLGEARASDDQHKILEYIDKVLFVDSSLTAQRHNIRQLARESYDLPQLREERAAINAQLRRKNNWIFAAAVLLPLTIVVALIFFVQKRKLSKRLDTLIITQATPISKKLNMGQKTKSLSSDMLDNLIHSLKTFETEKGFLNPKLNQAGLAKQLGTNSTYLSNLINQQKGVNFATYLKDLRITYAINQIRENQYYLKLTIQGLAEEFGFTHADSFSRAFKAKTKVSPSQFLARLRTDNL